MKRIVALLLCVLLIASAAGDVASVLAAGEKPEIKIKNYSVRSVLGVSSVYEVNLCLKWEKTVNNYPIESLELVTDGAHFKPAIRRGNSYTVSNEALDANGLINDLNSTGGTASQTFYFISLDNSAQLSLDFDFGYTKEGVIASGNSSDSITVVKSVPDPEAPKPDPEPEPDPEPVDTTKYKPVIGIASDVALPLLDPSTEELLIPIKNSSIFSANKVTIVMEATDKEKPLFSANRLRMSTSINILSRDQTKDAKFAIKLAPGAKTGIHQITLNYIFHNIHGDRFTDSETGYVQVENRNAAPRLSASCSEGLMPGQQSQVEFTLTNHGTTAARNVRITLEGLDPAGIALIGDIDVRHVDLIEGGESANIDYTLLPAKSLEGSSSRLQLKVDYSDTDGVTYSDTNAVFLPLYGVQEEDKGVPRLIISKYSFDPPVIRAGSECTLFLELQNTSRSKTITNLKVTILSDEGIFLPVDASNTVFIESIAAGDMVAVSLPMATKADAENKTYPLKISFDYEDSQGAAHNSQEMISVPVNQNSRLVVGEIALYGEPMLHEMVPVNVEFYNLGKTILYNLMVKAEGPFKMEGGRYFVGNFNPGASDSFNFAVTPTEPGEQVGEVIFQFEDSIGTQHEVKRELKLEVIEPFYPDDPGMDEPLPPPPTNKWKYVGIGAGVLVLAAAGFVFWRRRKMQKKLELQRAQDLTAAAQAVVPEIEYVGFEDEVEPDHPEPEQKD